MLNTENTHERDSHIQFEEYGHKYTITSDPKNKYTSVTTWIHSQFPRFDADKIIHKMMNSHKWIEGHKYWGMTPNQIKLDWNINGKQASEAGTLMHAQIETFMNEGGNGRTQGELVTKADLDRIHNSKEWDIFMKFIHDFPSLKPFRTEWMVFHEELKLAGSIDMIYEHEDGELSIYDWKRSKEISNNGWGEFGTSQKFNNVPNCNFWHYSIQLNVYRHIIETKYGRKIKDMALVRIHPNNTQDTYDLIPVRHIDIDADIINIEHTKKKIIIEPITNDKKIN